MLNTSQGWPPLLFIAPRAKLAVAPSLGKTRGHRTRCRERPDAQPHRPVLRRQPCVTSRLKSTVTANGYHTLAPDTSPLDAPLVHTGRVRCTPDPCVESSANSKGHRTRPTGCTLSVWCTPVRDTRVHWLTSLHTERANSHCLASGAFCTPEP